MKLTKAMKAQILAYVYRRGEDGFYWGNKEQFWDRHKKIIEWVKEQETTK